VFSSLAPTGWTSALSKKIHSRFKRYREVLAIRVNGKRESAKRAADFLFTADFVSDGDSANAEPRSRAADKNLAVGTLRSFRASSHNSGERRIACSRASSRSAHCFVQPTDMGRDSGPLRLTVIGYEVGESRRFLRDFVFKYSRIGQHGTMQHQLLLLSGDLRTILAQRFRKDGGPV
jgi:hypothetical protein